MNKDRPVHNPDPAELRLPPKLDFSYNPQTDVLRVEGVSYAGDVFRALMLQKGAASFRRCPTDPELLEVYRLPWLDDVTWDEWKGIEDLLDLVMRRTGMEGRGDALRRLAHAAKLAVLGNLD